ncbi:MAG: zinc ABC transporter solute-binding protein [Spirochaetales bacterium]|jgi:zinc transport system substrate-binding protein|nr:zinc ABC transporter substrate-binding protein [Exilispira sp.]NMC67106.1 zinc ABC transporter solute-binding protein [Spirochaetales bacterium]
MFSKIKVGNLLIIFIILFAALFAFFLTLSSCGTSKNQISSFSIYTSLEPIKFLIDNISGGEIPVGTLIKPGSDPHTFEISAKQLSDLIKSKAYFSIDLPFEKTLIDKIKRQNKNFKVYQLFKEEEGDEDVHIWLSISKIKQVSENILSSIIELYPEKKDIYKENYNNLLNKLDNLNDIVRFNIESSNIKSFLVFHPALTYFANDYGLNQISIENEGKVPSGSYLLEISKKIKKDNIRFIFVQEEFPIEQISQFVKDNNLEVVKIEILNYNLFDTLLKISEIFTKYKK